jgi:hypothetical protein
MLMQGNITMSAEQIAALKKAIGYRRFGSAHQLRAGNLAQFMTRIN